MRTATAELYCTLRLVHPRSRRGRARFPLPRCLVQLTLLDHLRLTFGHVVFRHRAHSQIAHRHSRWSRWLRVAEASLMALVALSACGVAFGKSTAYAILCAVFALAA